MKFNNTYYIIRHGLSTSNVQSYLSAWPEKKISRLTPEGKQTIKKAAQSFKKIGIDLIFTSDLHRTQQTAQIISKITGAKIIIDKGLRELNPGIFNHTYNIKSCRSYIFSNIIAPTSIKTMPIFIYNV